MFNPTPSTFPPPPSTSPPPISPPAQRLSRSSPQTGTNLTATKTARLSVNTFSGGRASVNLNTKHETDRKIQTQVVATEKLVLDTLKDKLSPGQTAIWKLDAFHQKGIPVIFLRYSTNGGKTFQKAEITLSLAQEVEGLESLFFKLTPPKKGFELSEEKQDRFDLFGLCDNKNVLAILKERKASSSENFEEKLTVIRGFIQDLEGICESKLNELQKDPNANPSDVQKLQTLLNALYQAKKEPVEFFCLCHEPNTPVDQHAEKTRTSLQEAMQEEDKRVGDSRLYGDALMQIGKKLQRAEGKIAKAKVVGEELLGSSSSVGLSNPIFLFLPLIQKFFSKHGHLLEGEDIARYVHATGSLGFEENSEELHHYHAKHAFAGIPKIPVERFLAQQLLGLSGQSHETFLEGFLGDSALKTALAEPFKEKIDERRQKFAELCKAPTEEETLSRFVDTPSETSEHPSDNDLEEFNLSEVSLSEQDYESPYPPGEEIELQTMSHTPQTAREDRPLHASDLGGPPAPYIEADEADGSTTSEHLHRTDSSSSTSATSTKAKSSENESSSTSTPQLPDTESQTYSPPTEMNIARLSTRTPYEATYKNPFEPKYHQSAQSSQKHPSSTGTADEAPFLSPKNPKRSLFQRVRAAAKNLPQPHLPASLPFPRNRHTIQLSPEIGNTLALNTALRKRTNPF